MKECTLVSILILLTALRLADFKKCGWQGKRCSCYATPTLGLGILPGVAGDARQDPCPWITRGVNEMKRY